ncbi:antibiotic biosynthesis monooxygenase [Rubellimicrobium sp. CFH 75288]|uniref:antibiotic biosynthesis monooxygenase family protein n=1 Tax=Rubellimicrobium sp. CFH 75288 TaxID=2697034 RepID=UPI0014124E78|nr:antibiotic biosynthesis monooxygenase [Rubellimicrobium sp. CFH 75288]NAZ37225.1 antibiotic biosynthesis monooxygenase [Rubellimicrobium sp. CFH 75288]
MFIAMNRFRIHLGREAEFERVWRTRRSHLAEVPGFIAFHLLRGLRHEDHTLYASHSVWECEEAFLDWTRSEAFRLAHRDAGGARDLYLGPPQFEGFVAVLGQSSGAVA